MFCVLIVGIHAEYVIHFLTLRPIAPIFFFCQELLRPLGEIEFLPGRLLQKLIDIGFCGGKWSEQACYDLGEYIFGFDDSNNNMVSKIMFNENLVFNEKLVLAYKWL